MTKYNTNNPYELAKIKNIKVVDESLPIHIGGFYTKIFGYGYIVINSERTEEWKRAIAAHELGHALLHNHEHTFLAMNNFVTLSKVEREANQFAANLLLKDEKPFEGETIFQFSQRTCVPIEFLNSLGKEGILRERW